MGEKKWGLALLAVGAMFIVLSIGLVQSMTHVSRQADDCQRRGGVLLKAYDGVWACVKLEKV
jgi:hypothetical protein